MDGPKCDRATGAAARTARTSHFLRNLVEETVSQDSKLLEKATELLPLIYAAALDQRKWDAFLSRLSHVAGGVYTHIHGHDVKGMFSLGIRYSMYEDASIKDYIDYYAQFNVWTPGTAEAPLCQPTSAETYFPKEKLLKTEFYNDWVRPQEDIGTGGGLILFKDDSRFLALGGNIRFRDQEKLQNEWLSLLAILSPHLRNAFEIARTLEGVSFKSLALDQAYRDLKAAVFVVTEAGRVVFSNTSGERLLEEGDVVKCNARNRLRLVDVKVDRVLQRSLRSLKSASSEPADVMHISDDSGGLSHVCRVSRFDPSDLSSCPFGEAAWFDGPCMLLTISALGSGQDVGMTLKAAYDLTDAEAAILLAVAEGASLRDIAESRGVSIHTVRNQMKMVQMKTDQRRQSGLVRLVERTRFLGSS